MDVDLGANALAIISSGMAVRCVYSVMCAAKLCSITSIAARVLALPVTRVVHQLCASSEGDSLSTPAGASQFRKSGAFANLVYSLASECGIIIDACPQL